MYFVIGTHSSLKYAAKETAFEIKYYGRKEVKRAVKERKVCMHTLTYGHR